MAKLKSRDNEAQLDELGARLSNSPIAAADCSRGWLFDECPGMGCQLEVNAQIFTGGARFPGTACGFHPRRLRANQTMKLQ